MARLKALLAVATLLALAALGALLAVDNHTPLALAFLGRRTPELPVFWWLYAAFLLGASCGFALCLLGFVRGKLQERRLARALADRDRELARLRGENAA